MALIAELVEKLRLDLGDVDETLLDDGYLERCIRRGVWSAARDLKEAFAIDDGEITPPPDTDREELMLIKAHSFACQLMRSITARNFKFSSADKSVDKTKQPEFWAELMEDLEDRYRQLLRRLKPETALDDERILPAPEMRPAIYEIWSDPDVG